MIQLNRQQTIILQALRQAGDVGVNSYDLRFKFHLIQAPVRIKELKVKGFVIATRDKKDRSVDYILMHEPEEKVLLHGEKPKKEEEPKLEWQTDHKTNTARLVAVEPFKPVQEGLFI